MKNQLNSTFNPFHMNSVNESREWFKTHTIAFYRFFKKTLTLPSGRTRLYNLMPVILQELTHSLLDTMYPDNRAKFLKNTIENVITGTGIKDFPGLNDQIPIKIFNTLYLYNERNEQGNDHTISFKTHFLKKNKKWIKKWLNPRIKSSNPNEIKNQIYTSDFFSLTIANVLEKYRPETALTQEEEEFVDTYARYLIMKSKLFKNLHFFSPREMIKSRDLYKILKYFFFYTSTEIPLKTEAYLKYFEYTARFYHNYTGIIHTGMNLQDLLFCAKISQIPYNISEERVHIRKGIIISNNIIPDFWVRDEARYCMNIFDEETNRVYGIIHKRSEKDILNSDDPGQGSTIEIKDFMNKGLYYGDEIRNNMIIDIFDIPVYNLTKI